MQNVLVIDRAKILKEKAELQKRLAFLERAEELLRLVDGDKVKTTGTMVVTDVSRVSSLPPRITLQDAATEAIAILGQFTRKDLERKIRDQYPGLPFNPKSLDRPMRDMINHGEIELLEKNIGNRMPAVYRFKKSKQS